MPKKVPASLAASRQKRRWKDVHPVRSRTMSAIKQKGTEPELAVATELRRLGYRFQASERDLPGTPDLVLRRHKVAIFVHGCYWHGHNCKHGKRQSKTNQDYWVAKLKRNRARDRRAVKLLKSMGWKSLVLWGCSLRDRASLRDKIKTFLAVQK